MNDTDKSAADKVLDVLEALSGYAVTGVSNSDLAANLKLNAATVTRATQTLIARGWVSKDDTSQLFRPTPRAGKIFLRILNDLDQAQRRLDDLRASYSH